MHLKKACSCTVKSFIDGFRFIQKDSKHLWWYLGWSLAWVGLRWAVSVLLTLKCELLSASSSLVGAELPQPSLHPLHKSSLCSPHVHHRYHKLYFCIVHLDRWFLSSVSFAIVVDCLALIPVMNHLVRSGWFQASQDHSTGIPSSSLASFVPSYLQI